VSKSSGAVADPGFANGGHGLSVEQPGVICAHAREFTSGLAQFLRASYGKIALMSNISKTVTDTTMGSMKAEYETDPGLLIGTMTFGLG